MQHIFRELRLFLALVDFGGYVHVVSELYLDILSSVGVDIDTHKTQSSDV